MIYDNLILIKLNISATAPKNQYKLNSLLPDGSAGGLVISKASSLNLHFATYQSSGYPIALQRL